MRKCIALALCAFASLLAEETHYTQVNSKIGNFANPGAPDLRPAKQALSEGNRADAVGRKCGDDGEGKNPSFEFTCVYKPLQFSTDVFEGLLALDPVQNGFIGVPFRASLEANAPEPTTQEFYEDPAVNLAQQHFEHFCENYHALPDVSLIPRLVHLIWLGSEPPQTVRLAIASWRKYHPDWTILLWTDNEVAELKWTTPHSAAFYSEAQNWAEKSDILRFEILYQFGGIYSDTDVICLKSFEDLRKRLDFFACFDENRIQKCTKRPLVGSAILGAAMRHPILKRCLEFSQTRSEAPDVFQHIRSGPGPITRAAYEAMEAGNAVHIFPCSYFFPLPYRKRTTVLDEIQATIRPESFAVHLWQASWFE